MTKHHLVLLAISSLALSCSGDNASRSDGAPPRDGPAGADTLVDGGAADHRGDDASQPDVLVPDTLSPDVAPPVCGDKVINGTEQCEAGQLGGQTCSGVGFAGGDLACKSDCSFDTSGCYKVLDPGGIALATTQDEEAFPTAAFDGTSYLVVWQTYSDVLAARVSPAGAVLDSPPITVSAAPNKQNGPAVACGPASCLVVWWDERGSSVDIYGARVSKSGAVLDPGGIPITTADKHQFNPAVAFDGTNYLVVWQTEISGSLTDIRGARVSQAGVVLDAAGLDISTDPAAQYFPAVAAGGPGHLVVWEDRRNGIGGEIFGARVSKGGALLDAAGIPIGTGKSGNEAPAVAHDGTDYFVVWQRYDSVNAWDIYGARVSAAGTVLDASGIGLCTAWGDQVTPSVAFGGSSHFVVWRGYDNATLQDIHGARISQAGFVLDSPPVVVGAAQNNQNYPRLAHGGNGYLAVWADFRSYTPNLVDVYGARIGNK